jgi:hypothetical protein
VNCPVCDTELARALVEMNLLIHPTCADLHEHRMQERNDELKAQLLEIIHWADRNSPRSKQLAIGPSEIGVECDQRVARTLAGMEQENFRFDVWAGIVGTGIHSWMQQAVDRYLEEHIVVQGDIDGPRWITENRVYADDVISGSSDLYTGDVIDYKSAASDKIKKMREGDVSLIPVQYRVQGHIYGLGNVRAGRKVRDIVLVFLPRNGLIKDMYLHREPYDEVIAFKALDRLYRLVDEMNELGLPEKPENWGAITMAPGPGCWYCGFFKAGVAGDKPNQFGCPGNSGTAEQNMEKSLKEWGGLL